jgi:hypothetical protein
MWGNPTREREIFFSASGKYISKTNSQFPAKIKYLIAPKLSPTNFSLKIVPNPYSCMTHSENSA